MKYTIQSILNTGKPIKYLFFWGHQPGKNGDITKSCFSQWWMVNFAVDEIELCSYCRKSGLKFLYRKGYRDHQKKILTKINNYGTK